MLGVVPLVSRFFLLPPLFAKNRLELLDAVGGREAGLAGEAAMHRVLVTPAEIERKENCWSKLVYVAARDRSAAAHSTAQLGELRADR